MDGRSVFLNHLTRWVFKGVMGMEGTRCQWVGCFQNHNMEEEEDGEGVLKEGRKQRKGSGKMRSIAGSRNIPTMYFRGFLFGAWIA